MSLDFFEFFDYFYEMVFTCCEDDEYGGILVYEDEETGYDEIL